MEDTEFDELEFFRTIEASGVRALLIGRQALIALGLPVLTQDYDFWVHIDDAARFNEAVASFGLAPNRTPEEARSKGRYVLENDEHVDVLVARSCTTVEGATVVFEDLWQRRQLLPISDGVSIAIPSLDDLILTKRFAARPRDAEDIRLLEVLRAHGAEGRDT